MINFVSLVKLKWGGGGVVVFNVVLREYERRDFDITIRFTALAFCKNCHVLLMVSC